MTTSARLIARALAACDAEVKRAHGVVSPLVAVTREMVGEYRIAVEQGIRAERAVHEAVKRLEDLCSSTS